MHGEISRDAAVDLLERSAYCDVFNAPVTHSLTPHTRHIQTYTAGKIGSYLVRPSKGNFTLSFR